MPDDIDFVALAQDIGIKYLFREPKSENDVHNLKRLSWDDVGEYLTEKEVASLIGCSVKTLRNNRSLRKGLPYTEIKGLIKYPKKELKRYLDNKTIRMDY